MRRSGCPTKGGNLGSLPVIQNVRPFLFCWISPSPKNWVPLSPDYIPYIVDEFCQKFCLRHAFSVTQSWLICKSYLELNPWIQSSVQQDYLPLRMEKSHTQQRKIYSFSPPEKKNINKFTSIVILIILI